MIPGAPVMTSKPKNLTTTRKLRCRPQHITPSFLPFCGENDKTRKMRACHIWHFPVTIDWWSQEQLWSLPSVWLLGWSSTESAQCLFLCEMWPRPKPTPDMHSLIFLDLENLVAVYEGRWECSYCTCLQIFSFPYLVQKLCPASIARFISWAAIPPEPVLGRNITP